jgi:hypothetical protein
VGLQSRLSPSRLADHGRAGGGGSSPAPGQRSAASSRAKKKIDFSHFINPRGGDEAFVVNASLAGGPFQRELFPSSSSSSCSSSCSSSSSSSHHQLQQQRRARAADDREFQTGPSLSTYSPPSADPSGSGWRSEIAEPISMGATYETAQERSAAVGWEVRHSCVLGGPAI